MIRIGIKYCGGCNPSYVREKVEEVLRKNFPDANFSYYSDGSYDIVVCISGCKRACAADAVSGNKVVSIDEELEEDKIVEIIRSLQF